MSKFEYPDWLLPPQPPQQVSAQADSLGDEIRVEALKNDFTARHQELFHGGPDAALQLTGESAMDAAEPTLAKLAEARDELLERTRNPAQRAMLAKSLDLHLWLARDDLDRHVAAQKLEWQKQTAQ